MRIFRWVAVVLLCTGIARADKVSEAKKPTGYVNDYASVLSPSASSQMEAICVELHDKTKAQLFVVTVETLDGEPIEQFANELFHTWKIGEKKTDRGALLLVAPQDHKYRIGVGYGLEGILNDAKVGDIGREMVPSLRTQDYDAALNAGMRPLAKTVADDAGVTLDSLQTGDAPPQDAQSVSDVPAPEKASPRWPWWAMMAAALFGVGFVGTFITFLVFFIRSVISGTRPRNTRRSLRDDDGPIGTGFVGSDDSSSSSSSSDSSSSDSFSGGDGGDSGGGGASGSW